MKLRLETDAAGVILYDIKLHFRFPLSARKHRAVKTSVRTKRERRNVE